MGRFIFGYGDGSVAVDIGDRLLEHLRIVIMERLGRGDACLVDAEVGGTIGRRAYWLEPSVPMRFRFDGERPGVDGTWIEELRRLAAGPVGLRLSADAEPIPAF